MKTRALDVCGSSTDSSNKVFIISHELDSVLQETLGVFRMLKLYSIFEVNQRPLEPMRI